MIIIHVFCTLGGRCDSVKCRLAHECPRPACAQLKGISFYFLEHLILLHIFMFISIHYLLICQSLHSSINWTRAKKFVHITHCMFTSVLVMICNSFRIASTMQSALLQVRNWSHQPANAVACSVCAHYQECSKKIISCVSKCSLYVFTIIPSRLSDPCNFITVLLVTREPEQTTLLFWSATCCVTPHGLHTANWR